MVMIQLAFLPGVLIVLHPFPAKLTSRRSYLCSDPLAGTHPSDGPYFTPGCCDRQTN